MAGNTVELNVSLKTFYDQLEPEIKEKAWRSSYVTKLVAQGKERVQVTEDYSTAASEIYTKRLQELGSAVTKFELANKVFSYSIPVDATRSKTEDVVRDLFGAIEWAGGCVLQIPQGLPAVTGAKVSFLPWDERGPVAGWTSYSLGISELKQQKPLDDMKESERILGLVNKHLSMLAYEIDINKQRDQIEKVRDELQALKDEFSGDPEQFSSNSKIGSWRFDA